MLPLGKKLIIGTEALYLHGFTNIKIKPVPPIHCDLCDISGGLWLRGGKTVCRNCATLVVYKERDPDYIPGIDHTGGTYHVEARPWLQ